MEKRFYKDGLEVRSVGGETKIYGWAITFNALSHDLGGFREKISERALDYTDMTDVVALLNHDNNFVLGRTPHTLKLNLVHGRGLQYEINPPKHAHNIIESIQRGDIRGSSFQFSITKDNGADWRYDDTLKTEIRTVKNIAKLYDCSPVTFPAYPNTDVALRGLQEFRSRTYMNYDINCAVSRERFLRQLFAEDGRSYENRKISIEKPYLNIDDADSRERYLRWLFN